MAIASEANIFLAWTENLVEQVSSYVTTRYLYRSFLFESVSEATTAHFNQNNKIAALLSFPSARWSAHCCTSHTRASAPHRWGLTCPRTTFKQMQSLARATTVGEKLRRSNSSSSTRHGTNPTQTQS